MSESLPEDKIALFREAFEVFDKDPENSRSLFGGGRYDGLVGEFGVEPVPTVGFGMGDVTFQNF